MGITLYQDGNRLAFRARCNENALHRIFVTLDGNIIYTSHDTELDNVLTGLGAAEHGCNVALHTYRAAYDIRATYTGERDPDLHFVNNKWFARDPNTKERLRCSHSLCGGPICHLSHYASISHHAEIRNAQEHDVQYILNWWKRHNRLGYTEGTNRGTSSHYLVSPRYRRATATVFGRNNVAHNATMLRTQGIRAEWVTLLAKKLPNTYKPPVGADPTAQLIRALGAARNLDAQKVAPYMAAGIRSHFYTYITQHVTPVDVLYMYHCYQGKQSLADHIKKEIDPYRVISSMVPNVLNRGSR